MLKISKKVILFFVLVINLFRQLAVGLGIFLYNRTLGSRWGAFICLGLVAFLLLVSAFVFSPSDSMVTAKPVDVQDQRLSTSVKTELELQKPVVEEQNSMEMKAEDLLAESTTESPFGSFESEFGNVDGISFQASEIPGSASMGRDEPFNVNIFMGGPEPGPGQEIGPGQVDELTEAERIEKERQEAIETAIKDIRSNITIKGIVQDTGGTDPMAILEYMNDRGDVVIKTVTLGEQIDLNTCSPSIAEIKPNAVDFGAVVRDEDISVRKHLPPFEDEGEGTVPVADVSDDLSISPDTSAGQGDSSSIDDAKKKIEEIDQLLDSF